MVAEGVTRDGLLGELRPSGHPQFTPEEANVLYAHPLAISFIRMGKYVFVRSGSLTRILAIAIDKDAVTQQQMSMGRAGP